MLIDKAQSQKLARIRAQPGGDAGRYMEEIWRSSTAWCARSWPLYETEVRGVDMLGRTAQYLFA